MEQHLSQYRIFYEVARCGNISGLQKNCISASRPSARPLESWEESLGTRLFLRNSRGVQLTPRETCSSSMWPPPLIP